MDWEGPSTQEIWKHNLRGAYGRMLFEHFGEDTLIMEANRIGYAQVLL